jgi:hypothetical protein
MKDRYYIIFNYNKLTYQVKLKVELPPERLLEGVTETQTQFIEHPLPERPPVGYHDNDI